MPTRHSGGPSINPISNRVNEVAGLIIISLAVFVALALWSFHPNDPSWSHRVSRGWAVRNLGGTVGAYLAGELAQILGTFTFLIPVGIFAWGVRTFTGNRSWWPGWPGLGFLMIILSGAGLFYKSFHVDPLFGKNILAGGLVGYGMAVILETYLGRVGSGVVLAGALLASVVATTGLSVGQVLFYLSRGPRWVLISFLPRVSAAILAGMVWAYADTKDFFRNGIKKTKLKKAAREVRKSGTFVKNLCDSWASPLKAAVELAGDKGSHDSKAVAAGEALDEVEGEPGDAVNPADNGNAKSGWKESRKEEPSTARGSHPEPAFGTSLASANDSGPVIFLGPAAEPAPTSSEVKNLLTPVLDEATDGAAVSLIPEEPVSTTERQRDGLAVGSSDEAHEVVSGSTPRITSEPAVVRDEMPDEGKLAVEGIRVGRKDIHHNSDSVVVEKAAEEPEAEMPMSIPSLDAKNESDDLNEGVSLKKALRGQKDEGEKNGVKVRHAGSNGESDIVRIEDDAIITAEAPAAKKSASRKSGYFELPNPADIFAEVKSSTLIVDEDAIRTKSALLEKTLREFGVEGKVTEVKTGPVITIYEFAPAAGIKVSKIASLSDDLARSLSAISVRIVAPIPGTNVVGIEVPNAERRAVQVLELISSKEFEQASDKLTLGLGKDILGRTAITDLAKIPHLLIAGSTGSGKSVAMNLMICSLLVRCHPREVRFLMIDPKMLEFSIYEGIPHLLVPVVTDPKRAASALRGVVVEMERRYQVMSNLGVRNIDSYNKLVAESLGPRESSRRRSQHFSEVEGLDEDGNSDFMPYIVVVIDELADLMMTSGREVEETMIRLAQMARAAGIHLLVATQRPSVDVLTGIIKANFPSRIALRVASRVDSRTILDMNGAERLLGKGDMLFVPPGTSAPVRIHGAFVSEDEIRNLVEHWKEQGPAAFREDLFVQAESKESGGDEGDQEYDERYDDAVALVARTGEASISLIQRHLRIGYNRAARLIEQMETEGVVGPAEGSKRRQVMIRNIPSPDVESIDAS